MHFKKSILTATALLLFSAIILTLIYLLANAPTQWLGHAPQTISGSSFNIARGVGHVEGDMLIVEDLGADGIAIAAYQSYGLKAQAYPQLTLNASTAADTPPEVLLLWRTAENPGTTTTRRLGWQGNQLARLPLAEDPDWQGEIIGLALVIRGAINAPLVIKNLTLQSNSSTAILADLLDGWGYFEPWHGGAINYIYGGKEDAAIPIVLGATLLLALALFIYGVWVKWRHHPIKPAVIAVVLALIWVLVDLRWQGNLWAQLGQTHARYAGKNWADKHRAAEDGDLFNFTQAIKAKLGGAPARVLVFSDVDYFRGRAAYHLYPHNVYYLIKDASLPAAELIRPGEYLFLYQKRGVQYHPGKKELLWNGKPLLVEPILVANGNAFFKVR